jgi:hypothetical protein
MIVFRSKRRNALASSALFGSDSVHPLAVVVKTGLD